MTNSRYLRRLGACAAILAALALAACKSDSGAPPPVASQTITVVGTDTTESKVLTELYAEALEAGGFRVARRSPVDGLDAGYAALQSGAADLFVTHTNDLLTFLADHESAAAASTSTTAATTTTLPETTTTVTPTTDGATATPPTAAATTTTVSVVGQAAAVSISLQSNQIGEILPDTLQIGAASNAENKDVIACNGGVSGTLSLSTLTDLAFVADGLRIAGPADFETGDPFGLPGFERVYGATFKEFVAKDSAAVGDAITPPTTVPASSTTGAETTVPATDEATTTTAAEALDIDADCGAFNSLDATIPDDAIVMDDDKDWITTNGVIPLLTATAYTPGASQTIDQVSQALRTADLRAMIKFVDEGNAANLVVSNFLTQAGIGG